MHEERRARPRPAEIQWRGERDAVLAGSVQVERFDAAAGGEQVRACHEMYLAGLPRDDPLGPAMSPRVFAAWLAYGWTEDPVEPWLGRDRSGHPCGYSVLTLPERENRHIAFVNVLVDPAHRRAGVGSALVRHAAERASRAGRSLLSADALADSPGSAFARAWGARPEIADVRRVLDVRALRPGELTRLRSRAEGAAAGYALVSWEGPSPDDQLPAVAALNAATADMPRMADTQAQRWDTERVRMDEQRMMAQGLRHYTVAARSQAGELAGLTQLSVDPSVPGWGFQEFTVVARPHRGHRLGLLVKVAMLELLADREPQVTRIITGNADSNEHMIAINAELGFTVLDRWEGWTLPARRALAARVPG